MVEVGGLSPQNNNPQEAVNWKAFQFKQGGGCNGTIF